MNQVVPLDCNCVLVEVERLAANVALPEQVFSGAHAPDLQRQWTGDLHGEGIGRATVCCWEYMLG